MGVLIHRIITVTGRTQLAYEAHKRMLKTLVVARDVASHDDPCILSQVHDLMNDLSTFTLHSRGSKAGYSEHLMCERLMDDFSRWLRSAEHPMEFVDLTYSKDRYMDGLGHTPYVRIENVPYRERSEDDD